MGRKSYFKVPVIDHWWQTETSWAIISSNFVIEMQKQNMVQLDKNCNFGI